MTKSLLSNIGVSPRVMRLPQVCALLSVSRATVWRMSQSDPSFPKPFKLGPAITVWNEEQVLNWLDSKRTNRAA